MSNNLTLELLIKGNSAEGQKAVREFAGAVNEAKSGLQDFSAKSQSVSADIEQSFKSLGIRSFASIRGEIADTRSSFELLKASGSLSGRELAIAQDAAKAKIADLRREMGETVPAFNDLKNHGVNAANQIGAGFQSAGRMATDALGALAAGWGAVKLGGLIADSTMLAGRYQELGIVMKVVGNNAGYSAEQMDEYARKVQGAGISMLESRNTVIQLAQANIDLSESQKLARIAQDAAVVGQMNSSEALNNLIYGIKTAQVDVLRTIGINVNFEESYARLAKQLGVSTGELDEHQKMLARVQVVLDEGAKLNGVYEASLDSATKQIRSSARYIEDFKVTMGEVFNEALTVAVMAVTDELKSLNGEARELAEKNQLKQWGNDVSGILAFAADAAVSAAIPFRILGSNIGSIAATMTALARGELSSARAIMEETEQANARIVASASTFRDALEQRRTASAAANQKELDQQKQTAKLAEQNFTQAQQDLTARLNAGEESFFKALSNSQKQGYDLSLKGLQLALTEKTLSQAQYHALTEGMERQHQAEMASIANQKNATEGENQRYAQQLTKLKADMDARIITQTIYNAASEAAEQAHQDILKAIDAQGEEERANIKKSFTESDLGIEIERQIKLAEFTKAANADESKGLAEHESTKHEIIRQGEALRLTASKEGLRRKLEMENDAYLQAQRSLEMAVRAGYMTEEQGYFYSVQLRAQHENTLFQINNESLTAWQGYLQSMQQEAFNATDAIGSDFQSMGATIGQNLQVVANNSTVTIGQIGKQFTGRGQATSQQQSGLQYGPTNLTGFSKIFEDPVLMLRAIAQMGPSKSLTLQEFGNDTSGLSFPQPLQQSNRRRSDFYGQALAQNENTLLPLADITNAIREALTRSTLNETDRTAIGQSLDSTLYAFIDALNGNQERIGALLNSLGKEGQRVAMTGSIDKEGQFLMEKLREMLGQIPQAAPAQPSQPSSTAQGIIGGIAPEQIGQYQSDLKDYQSAYDEWMRKWGSKQTASEKSSLDSQSAFYGSLNRVTRDGQQQQTDIVSTGLSKQAYAASDFSSQVGHASQNLSDAASYLSPILANTAAYTDSANSALQNFNATLQGLLAAASAGAGSNGIGGTGGSSSGGGAGGGSSWSPGQPWPKFHSGGIVGEEDITALRGEGVFTPAQMRALAPVGARALSSPVVNITVQEAPGTVAEISQKPNGKGGVDIGVIVRQVQNEIASQIRRGGGIASALENTYGLRR